MYHNGVARKTPPHPRTGRPTWYQEVSPIVSFVIQLAHDLGFLAHEQYDQLSESTSEIKRMLTAFSQKLKAES